MKPNNYYSQDFDQIDFREQPELYKVGKGEQGVLSVEPYKTEILPHWRFKTPEIAKTSSQKIYQLFLEYLEKDDFIGADMARKFLQMGYTRSRRYANHKSGRKYSSEDKEGAILPLVIPPYKDARNKQHFIVTKTKKVLPLEPDNQKARSAEIFFIVYQKAKKNTKYLAMKKIWQQKFG